MAVVQPSWGNTEQTSMQPFAPRFLAQDPVGSKDRSFRKWKETVAQI